MNPPAQDDALTVDVDLFWRGIETIRNARLMFSRPIHDGYGRSKRDTDIIEGINNGLIDLANCGITRPQDPPVKAKRKLEAT